MEQIKVVVAMSGGVDSSVTAALLKERGYDVMGVTMRLSEPIPDGEVGRRACCPQDSFEDARKVSEIIGIPHYVADFRSEFNEKVIKKFLNSYANGLTPNPCIDCNRFIKFDAFLQKAIELGATHIATGHYAKIECIDSKYFLKKANDASKDQSYVLYSLRSDYLKNILLPLGNYDKTDVRDMAEKFNLPVAHKSDSQEICFVPKDDYRSYLQKKLPESFKAGDIVDTSGKVLGRHNGIAFYTIGQRKGLGITSEYPIYVVGLDKKNNHVIVGKSDEVYSKALIATNFNWLDNSKKILPKITCLAKIRYKHQEAECTAEKLPNNKVYIQFEKPQRAVTCGQAVVLYDGDVVIGGGTIDEAINKF